jgi:hypothetical protein
MSFIDMVKIEFKKVKRSFILPLIFIPPLLVVISGVSNLSMYFTPEYKGAWAAMFVQSGLLFGYYLLPFSMVVTCVMISGRETKNNGILKMLALPISRKKMAVAKWVVLLIFIVLEITIFFISFVVAGWVATKTKGISETLPVLYVLKWSIYLFLSSITAASLMWMITVFFEKPIITIGLNMLLVIPAVFVASTPAWVAYPYCYSGRLVTSELHRVSMGVDKMPFDLFPLIPCAIAILILSIFISAVSFGKKEMK